MIRYKLYVHLADLWITSSLPSSSFFFSSFFFHQDTRWWTSTICVSIISQTSPWTYIKSIKKYIVYNLNFLFLYFFIFFSYPSAIRERQERYALAAREGPRNAEARLRHERYQVRYQHIQEDGDFVCTILYFLCLQNRRFNLDIYRSVRFNLCVF